MREVKIEMLGQLDSYVAFAVVILALSLLITILNQAVAAVLALRGRTLTSGLETLLEQMDPALASHARAISRHVVEHPLISDSTFSRASRVPVIGALLRPWIAASCIRVDELTNVLRRLAERPPQDPNAARTWKHQLYVALEEDGKRRDARLSAAAAALAALNAPAGAQLETLAPQVADQVRKAVGDIELWFDTMMGRVSQRFAVRMRIWTAVWAILIAFSLHLDASALFRQIQDNPAVRARLIASTDLITQQAETLVEGGSPDVFQKAALTLHDTSADLKGLPRPTATTRNDVYAWIRAQPIPAVRHAALEREFERLVGAEVNTVLADFGRRATDIRNQLQITGIQIVPNFGDHTRSDRWPDLWVFAETPPGTPRRINAHFLGVLFSAVLLSLGAPFWFHMLKTAATLRPVIADVEQKERSRRS